MNLTPQAAAAIQTLLGDREEGGLRIFVSEPDGNGPQVAVGLSLAGQADPDDEIVAEHGSQVFVERRLSTVLADKTLDLADEEAGGGVGFRLVT